MSESTCKDSRRERVVRLLDFLTDVASARSAPVRDVNDHTGVVWLDADTGDRRVKYRSKAGPGERLIELHGTDDSDGPFAVIADMLDQLAEHPESLELVVASGLVTYVPDVDGTPVREHLLTQRVVADHDHDADLIRIMLTNDSSPVLHDRELLTDTPGLDMAGSGRLRDQAAALGSVVGSAASAFVRRWQSEVVASPDADIAVDFAPALVLRQRGSRTIVDYFQAMRTAIDGGEVPVALTQLVESVGSDERVEWVRRSGAMSAAELVEDALYPLSSNVEQRDILSQLGSDSGVVVEGPAGTGKTHTIANLLAALLAKGQRVLVVSEKAQALHVLRQKLPAELHELVVDLSDVTRDGSAALVDSVSAIADRKASYQPRVSTSEIKNALAKRDQARAKRERLLLDMWQLRESETERHEWVAPGYSGTPAQIARDVRAGEDRYSWLAGPLESPLPPLDSDEFERLLQLLRDRTDRWSTRLSQTFFDIDSLVPDSVEIDRICARVHAVPHEPMVGTGSLLAILSDVDSARLLAIKDICDGLRVAVNEFSSFPDYLREMTDRLLSGEASYMWNRLTQLSSVIDDATARDSSIGTHIVSVENAKPGDSLIFRRAADYVNAGGRWGRRFRRSPQQRAVEESGVTAIVDGSPPADADTLALVADHLAVLDDVRTVRSVLSEVNVPVSAQGARSAQLNELVRLDDQLSWISALLTGRDSLIREIERISPGGPRPKSVAELAEVAQQAGAIATANAGYLARRQLDEIASGLSAKIDKGPSPEGDALLAALAVADPVAIRDARRDWNTALSERDMQGALDLLELRLKQKAPGLHSAIVADPRNRSWANRLRDIGDAWSWRLAYSWIEQRSDPDREKRLEAALDAVDADIDQLTARLAAASAWRECLDRMSVAEVQALQSYRDHMSNVGKGAGRHAERFRRAARSAMAQAQGAVPAWVMPISHVTSSVAPVHNSFDVVIVDEASQADITSLFLLWLAPRVIVVGDDRQCAPGNFAAAGMDEVFDKLDTYLPDMPEYLRDSLTPRSSLFSLLRTRFGRVVRLREHFRSMPEIIEFSSRQFYPDSPLVPVRQFGADRLPPLRSVFVADAVATGQNASLSNPAEAAALARAVADCVDDPRYRDRGIGVVVLQGQRQVETITQELRKELTPGQWRHHRIRVGTPPDFQGDEREVMFISMVVTADQNLVALTRSESQRRFNVAASRAMDQMWLVHSVRVDDLRVNDLRRSLLSYFESIEGAVIAPMPAEVPVDSRVEPFDSLFEQRIFNELAARGYHVNPKVTVNNRVIDLVVVGAEARIAVECDGDEFTNTPEQSRADLERERELRRCGWRFWRIRESEYLFDSERALSGLWRELESRGVKPGSVQSPVAYQDGEWEPIDLGAG